MCRSIISNEKLCAVVSHMVWDAGCSDCLVMVGYTMPTNMLVTSFSAFQGRAQNGSTFIGQAIAQHLNTSRRASVLSVTLPVVWQGVRDMMGTINVPSFDIAIGIGEGFFQGVMVELLGNASAFHPDELKLDPPSLSDIFDMSLPIQLPMGIVMLPGDLDEEAQAVKQRWGIPLLNVWPNDSTDSYLCNCVRRLMAEQVTRKSAATKVGFFHVPPMEEWLTSENTRRRQRHQKLLTPEDYGQIFAGLIIQVLEKNGLLGGENRYADVDAAYVVRHAEWWKTIQKTYLGNLEGVQPDMEGLHRRSTRDTVLWRDDFFAYLARYLGDGQWDIPLISISKKWWEKLMPQGYDNDLKYHFGSQKVLKMVFRDVWQVIRMGGQVKQLRFRVLDADVATVETMAQIGAVQKEETTIASHPAHWWLLEYLPE